MNCPDNHDMEIAFAILYDLSRNYNRGWKVTETEREFVSKKAYAIAVHMLHGNRLFSDSVSL